jgi:K+-sensing histidine kinase KdpD
VATLLVYVLTWLPDPYASSDYTNIALIYLVATVFSTVSWSLTQGLVTAVAGFALYHFYFRPPTVGLNLAPHEFVSLLVFISASAVAALIGAEIIAPRADHFGHLLALAGIKKQMNQ